MKDIPITPTKVAISKPPEPSKAIKFFIANLFYILCILVPMKYGFGLYVKDIWAIIIPCFLFSWLVSR